MSSSSSTVRIKLNPEHALVGYHAKDPASKRRAVLLRHVKDRGFTKVIRRVNVLTIYFKRKDPKLAAKFKTDVRYLQKQRNTTKKKKPSPYSIQK